MMFRKKLTWEKAEKLIAAATQNIASETLCPEPLVSVWMLSYNHASFIRQALNSVLMQVTSFPFEIVIGDDCSTDGTIEILLEYQRKHPEKIRVLLARENLGHHTGTARLNNIRTYRACRGKYIAMLDGDDYWTDIHKLEKQVAYLSRNPDCVACHNNAVVIDAEGLPLKDSKLRSSQQRDFTRHEQATGAASLLTLTVCFRNVIREFPPEFLLAPNGDTFFFSLLAEHGHSRYLGDQIQPDVYRVHSGGIWSARESTEKIWWTLTTRYLLARYYRRTGKMHYSMLLLERCCTLAFGQRRFPRSNAVRTVLSNAEFSDLPLLVDLALVSARHVVRLFAAKAMRFASQTKQAVPHLKRRARQRVVRC